MAIGYFNGAWLSLNQQTVNSCFLNQVLRILIPRDLLGRGRLTDSLDVWGLDLKDQKLVCGAAMPRKAGL